MVSAGPLPDGGNPRRSEDIQPTADGWLIRPFSEDGDPNYKFRLLVGLANEGRAPEACRFTIEWQDAEYAKFRRYLLVAQGDDWQAVPAEADGTRITAVVRVPTGESRLCLHPPFPYGEMLKQARALPPGRFRVQCIGRSLRGRDLLAIEAGVPDGRPIVLVARFHPCQSVGNSFVQGMWAGLAAESAAADSILQRHRLVFLPMPNPDGVAEGLCKRTADGLNLNEAAASSQPEAAALKEFLERLCQRGWFDVHGFMWENSCFSSGDRA